MIDFGYSGPWLEMDLGHSRSGLAALGVGEQVTV